MPANPYDDLLQEFRDVYAKYGEAFFPLYGFTGEEWAAQEEGLRGTVERLGAVPLSEAESDGSFYWIVGVVRKDRWGRPAEPWRDAFDCFAGLAKRAGASLPLAIREQIEPAAADPASWWLTYMWRQAPPSKEDLAPPDGVRSKYRLIWSEPFLASGEAIERGNLCTTCQGRTGKAVRSPQNRGRKPEHGSKKSDARKARMPKRRRKPPAPSCAVVLRGENEPPIVFGKKKNILNPRPYAIVKTLVGEWPARLSKGQLEKRSARSEAHKNLAKLRRDDSDWKKAILMPGRPGKKYGLAAMP